MMKGSFKIGTIAGIAIFIHWTFAILIAYIVFSNYRAGQNLSQIIWSVMFVLSIFVTVFLHELGHALAAKRYNIQTKDITLLPIGGLARLESMPEKPKEELVVAIAGPIVNVALALLTSLFVSFPTQEELTAQLAGGVNGDNFLLNFMVVNLWLAFFNLIPAFPMDGGRVLRALLSMKMQRHVATTIAARIGQFLAIGFVFAGFYSNPFLIFIGLFIMLGAQSEAEATKTGFMMKGVLVSEIVMKNYETLDENDTVGTAVQKLLDGQSRNFLVVSNHQPVGSLSRDEMIAALAGGAAQKAVHTVMNKELLRFEADQPIELVYQNMLSHKVELVAVYQNADFLGILDLENILEFIMVKNVMQVDKG